MTSQLELPTLCKTIKVLVEKGDRAKEKSEEFYIAAGQHLIELKQRMPDEATWPDYVKEHCGLAKSRANELIQIADGRTTVENVRATKAASVRKSRMKRPLRSGQYVTDDLLTIDDDDDAHTVWRRGLMVRAEAASADATYEDWSQFKVDEQLAIAVRRAADAWSDLAAYIERIERGVGRIEIAERRAIKEAAS